MHEKTVELFNSLCRTYSNAYQVLHVLVEQILSEARPGTDNRNGIWVCWVS